MKTLEDLKKIRDEASKKLTLRDVEDGYRVVVGMATCGITAGARQVLNAIVDEVARLELKNVLVTQVGCMGECALEPIVEVYNKAGERTTYCKVKPEDAKRIINDHILNHTICNDLLMSNYKK
jgi:NADP-reducing hydrogenase subunit HndB